MLPVTALVSTLVTEGKRLSEEASSAMARESPLSSLNRSLSRSARAGEPERERVCVEIVMGAPVIERHFNAAR